MIETWRFPAILGLSVLFGMPALHDLMMRPQGILRSGFAYLGALVLSWVGVNAICRLMHGYAADNTRSSHHQLAALLAEERRAAGVTDDDGDTRPVPAGPPDFGMPASHDHLDDVDLPPELADDAYAALPQPTAHELMREDEPVGAPL